MSRAAAPTRLVIIRHGEAQSYVDQVIGGFKGCTGLSDLGRRQAAALRDRLAETRELGDVGALYASVLPRAIETAEIIAPALGSLSIETDCDLCEVHPGEEIDGLPIDEFEARYGRPTGGNVYDPWAPGAESWAEFVVRTSRRLHRLAIDHEGETVVIAGHGGIVDAAFRALGDLPIQRRFSADVVNTSITEWVRTPTEWQLSRFNDAGHLARLGGHG